MRKVGELEQGFLRQLSEAIAPLARHGCADAVSRDSVVWFQILDTHDSSSVVGLEGSRTFIVYARDVIRGRWIMTVFLKESSDDKRPFSGGYVPYHLYSRDFTGECRRVLRVLKRAEQLIKTSAITGTDAIPPFRFELA